jgi:site-specific recombinase XerD
MDDSACQGVLGAEAFRRLADVPAEVEWFADIQNPNTRDAYRRDVGQFMAFLGIEAPEDFRQVARAHVIAWRKDLEALRLGPASIRRKLSAVSSLFESCANEILSPTTRQSACRGQKRGQTRGKPLPCRTGKRALS